MKKFLTYGLVIATIAWSVGLALNVPDASASYPSNTGYLIKTANNPAVYYAGTDGKRHLYSNSATFWTWYTGTWSSIKFNGLTSTIRIISQAEFDNLPSGDNITAKSGSLLKFDNSSRIYMVTQNGASLAPVPDTNTAQRIFGSNWSSKLITIQGSFETDYTKDGVLDGTNSGDSNPKIALISPNGGEAFMGNYVGKVINVKWMTTNDTSDKDGINLLVLDSNGKEIANSSILCSGSSDPICSQASYDWTPNLPDGKYKIKAQICTIVGPIEATCGKVLAEDSSDSLFTVSSAIIN